MKILYKESILTDNLFRDTNKRVSFLYEFYRLTYLGYIQIIIMGSQHFQQNVVQFWFKHTSRFIPQRSWYLIPDPSAKSGERLSWICNLDGFI